MNFQTKIPLIKQERFQEVDWSWVFTDNEKIKGVTMPNLLKDLEGENSFDEKGMPFGGYVKGVGIDIKWQNGPLGRGAERTNPNGAFVETIIAIAKQRIEHYQTTKFNCRENSIAITKLEEALMWLNLRTERREKQGVEGTYKGA